MIKTFLSRAAIIIVASLSLFAVSCIQEEYKISEETLNLEMTVFQEGVSLPLGSTDSIKISQVLELYADDELKKMFPVGEDGSYSFGMSDEFDFSSELEFLSENFMIDGIKDEMDVPFDLSSVNVSDVRVDAMEIAYEQKLSEVIEPLELEIDPITMEPFTQTTDISSYVPSDEELNIAIEDYGYSGIIAKVNDIDIPQAKLDLLTTIGFDINQEYEVDAVLSAFETVGVEGLGLEIFDEFTLEEPISVPVEISLPEMIESVEEIVLHEGAKVRISLDLSDNLFFTSGNITPHIDLDVHEIFHLTDEENELHDPLEMDHIIGDFELNVGNGYSCTEEYEIQSLVVNYEEDFKIGENGCLEFAKEISITPSVELRYENLMTSVNFLNDHPGGDVSMAVKIEFIDFYVDDVAVTVKPIEVEFNEVFEIEINESLPDMVTGVQEVTFTENSGINIDLDIKNVDRIPGLDLAFDALEFEFPNGINVEGTDAENKLNLPIGSLSDGVRKEVIKITGITLDPETQPEGTVAFKGEVKIRAAGRVDVKEGESIHTKDLPRSEDQDIEFGIAAVAEFELDNFKVGFDGYEYEIEDQNTGEKYIEQVIEFEVAKEVADLGKVKIVPETVDGEQPVITVDIVLPETQLPIGAVKDGLIIDFPNMITFGEFTIEPNVNHTYDAVENILTFSDELPDKIELPIEYLMAEATAKTVDGKEVYVVSDYFKVMGTIGVSPSIVVKEDIDALTSPDAIVSFKADVPEMVPATVNVNSYQAPIEKQSFNLGESIDLSTLPDQLVGVDKIELKDVYLDLEIKAEGINSLLTDADVEAVIDIALPSVIMIEKNEDIDIDENNNLHVSATLENEEIKIAPLHVIGLDLSDIDLSDEDALKDLKIELEGNITVSNATVDMSELEGTELNIDVNYGLATQGNADNKIEIAKVSGYVDYAIEPITEEVDLSALTDALNSDQLSATIDLNRFSLALDLKTNLSVPLVADLSLVPYKDGAVIEGKTLSKELAITIPESTGEPSLVRYWISNYPQDEDPYMPEGYEHISLDLISLIKLSPEKINIVLNAGTDSESLCSIAPSSEGYVLSAAYAFNLPFEFGEDMKLEFRQTIDNLPEELGTILQYGSLGLTGQIESSLPLELDMTYNFLDSEGNAIPLSENAGHQTIKPGTITGDAVTTDLNIIVGIDKSADVSGITSLELVFKATSLAGAPIKENTFIKATLQALIPEGITFDAAEFLKKEE